MNIQQINNSQLNKLSFKSYNNLNQKTKMSVSTSFYNDYETLQNAVNIIESTFPKGTELMVYAGSNGEEAISIYSMLKNPDNYYIYSIDPYKEAVDYANNGIYAVHKMYKDGFLQKAQNGENSQLTYLRDIFNKTMSEIDKPSIQLRNMSDYIYNISLGDDDFQKYYKLKPPAKKHIQFAEGDIKNISEFKTKEPKVGAIFFRNAIYHITNNDLTGVIKYGDTPDRNTYKLGVCRQLMRDIDKKLCVGGIFVMGDHLQEHLYIADRFTPIKNSVFVNKNRNVRYMLNAPHIQALEEIETFKPIFDKKIKQLGIKMPLIWQKVR